MEVIILVSVLVLALAFWDVGRRYTSMRSASELAPLRDALDKLKAESKLQRGEIDAASHVIDSVARRLLAAEQTLSGATEAFAQLKDAAQFLRDQKVWNEQQDAILKKLYTELPEKFETIKAQFADVDRRIADKVLGKGKAAGTYGR